MKKYPKLNFPRYRHRISRDESGGFRIWDDLRGIWLVLTPEEWVRRHVLRFLLDDTGVLPGYITQEYPVSISGMNQRADIVVSGRDASPLLLVECKGPGIAIDNSVYAQAVRYNSVVGAKYIMLTNGIYHYVLENKGNGDYAESNGFPPLEDYFK